jgi:hypothetical protein
VSDNDGPEDGLPEGYDNWNEMQQTSWAWEDDLPRHEQKRRRSLFMQWEREHKGLSPIEPEKPAKRPFVILTRADIRAMPRVQWFLHGLVQTSGLVVLGGNGSVGKSAIAFDWAACITTGRAWHGRKVKTGNVLYIAGEGVEGIEDRLVAWEAMTGVPIPDGSLEFVAEGFNLSNTDAVDYAREMVEQRDYALVVLDTLSQVGGLENENDNAEMSRVLGQAKAIRQARPGTTVLIIHHTSKGGGMLRGASALRDNADAVVMAQANPTGFSLTTESKHDGKQKNGREETLDGFWLEVVPVDTEPDGTVRRSIVVRRGGQNPMVQAILAIVADGAEHPGLEFYLACVGVGATPAEEKTVRRALADLVADGTLSRTGSTKDSKWRLGQP